MVEQRSYRRLAALAHAGNRLSAVAGLDEAVEIVAHSSLALIEGASASVGRIDASTGLIRIVRNLGDLAPWELEFPTDEVYPLADFPWLDRSPDRVTAWYGAVDDADINAGDRAVLESIGKRAMLTVPLVADGVVWGMIAVVRGWEHASFTAEDLAAGEALGGMVGAALARIEERTELRALVYRDALTGLGNRRAVDERLEQLFDDEPIAVGVVLCDVNGLKEVNDQHGHHAGDTLLREVARLLSAEAGRHPGALAARLGGDEFCLVVDAADAVALEDAVTRLTGRARSLRLGRGLSCGAAVLHERPVGVANNREAGKELLRLADEAQYRAKRNGSVPERRSTASVGYPSGGRSLVAELIDRGLAAVDVAGGELVDRLAAAAAGVATATNACTWTVSRRRDGGEVVAIRDGGRHDGDEGPVVPSAPTSTRPGGSGVSLQTLPWRAWPERERDDRHVTVQRAEAGERAYLGARNAGELIVAGRRVGDDAWLVEVCGDEGSEPLGGLAAVLRAVVEVAVVGAEPIEREDADRTALADGAGGALGDGAGAAVGDGGIPATTPGLTPGSTAGSSG